MSVEDLKREKNRVQNAKTLETESADSLLRNASNSYRCSAMEGGFQDSLLGDHVREANRY